MAGFNRTALRREIGKVQRLCCLGLGGQMLIPALIRELQAILPCYNANFWWGGPHQGISNVYVAIGNPEPISIYYEEFYQRRERDVWLTFAEGMRTLYPTAGDLYQRILKVDRRDYFKSDLYNLVMRPLGGDQVLHRRFAEHGRGLGSLQLCRKSKESSFSANDCKLLDGIARFVAHGMTSAPRDQVFVDTEERAVIIVDQLGRTNSASSHAYRLLEMAFSPCWDSRARWHLSRYAQPELARLCRSLLTSTVGAISTEPPVCRRRNAWGEFVLRAYWLEPTDGTAASRFIAITIVQREPKHLRLLRQIERLPLTGREKQLCLLLTRDQARADIADTMGVSEATVISHRRNVFDKLGVHSRIGLIEFLDQQR